MDYQILKKGDTDWLSAADQIEEADWKAAKYLANKMKNNEFLAWEGVVAAIDNGKIVGFCSFVEKDIVDNVPYTPYIAIVYVDPTYRGKHISQQLVRIAEEQLAKNGFEKVYIATQHQGLYEKSGYQQINQAPDRFGREMRILEKSM
ncbi:MAG TPA: GNAT family N-acetyltransferase [Enterococcus sp.]|uniref:GNAT family N-acetyltransferase n=1 Tax=Enterococcus sp. TaxID=35783 RepID=UPI000EEC6927|nr:GNAT family N-acetyltransferase [Enterococcus sp.]HCE12043.1 GNAT family N-acetyltransferase [Enterococcus sp.]